MDNKTACLSHTLIVICPVTILIISIDPHRDTYFATLAEYVIELSDINTQSQLLHALFGVGFEAQV